MADAPEAPRGLEQFPDEIREDVNGLLFLGHLEDDFEVFGHHFVIRTLKGDEELNAGVLTKEYQDTLSQSKAAIWANVCQALVSVDYDNDFCPPAGPDKLSHARARFRYCTHNWYWLTAWEIWGRLRLLNARQLAAANAIRDLSTRSPENFSPSPDSLTEPGTSEEPPEILEHLDEDSTESNS
jgi:hypothetical protein